MRAASSLLRSRAPVGPTRLGDEQVERLHSDLVEALHARFPPDDLAVVDDRKHFALAWLSTQFRAIEQAHLRDGYTPLDEAHEREVKQQLLDRMFGMGRIQPLIDDPEITDIDINGCDAVFISRRDGSRERVAPVAASDEELVRLVKERITRYSGGDLRWDPDSYFVSVALPGRGGRLTAMYWRSTRPAISIRRHDFSINQLEHLVERKMLPPGAAQLLAAAVRAKLNIIVSGGTGGGKTTLLRCLIGAIPSDVRILTVEDALEIGVEELGRHPNSTELCVRQPNVEGKGSVSAAQLVRDGLRMNPDRVMVGEVRGHEVLAMLSAMTQGNDGSMGTVHANSSVETLGRLVGMLGMTPEKIPPWAANRRVSDALDLVVHVAKVSDRSRRVTSIHEVGSTDGDSALIATNELARLKNGQLAPSFRPSAKLLDRLVSDGGLDPDHWENTSRWLTP